MCAFILKKKTFSVFLDIVKAVLGDSDKQEFQSVEIIKRKQKLSLFLNCTFFYLLTVILSPLTYTRDHCNFPKQHSVALHFL